MAKCLQKFLPQAYTTVSSCQEKKGSVRTKRIEALYTKLGRASVCQCPMERGSDGEMRRGGDGERGRLEDEERGRVRWGGGQIGRISISLFSLLPSS
jgi:hypothetical protein